MVEDKDEDDAVKSDEDRDAGISDDEVEKPQIDSTTPATPLDQLSLESLKRKRDQLLEEEGKDTDLNDESMPNKLMKSETPPPPPPPPAPVNGVYPDIEEVADMAMDGAADTPMADPSSTTGDIATQPPAPPVSHSINGRPSNMPFQDGKENHGAGGQHEDYGEDRDYPRPVDV